MDLFQFYPTPIELAKKAWGLFKDKDFVRVLEPSAGDGAFATAHDVMHENHRYYRRNFQIDACEIDLSKHAVLREKGIKVIGLDFMAMRSASHYSHILMNPPFHAGVAHVLKAWEILWDGEIVAIINAESLRNAHTKERKFLVELIKKHGSVEFIEGAFSVEEAERKTDVDVALIYLHKKADVSADILGDVMAELKQDTTGETLADDYREAAELALPNSLIENTVAAFNAAVRTMKSAVITEARAQYFERLLGDTMAVRKGDLEGKQSKDTSVDYVKNTVATRFSEIQDRAWSNILSSTNITSKLSSAALKRVESEFEFIKQLDFTVLNILGFVLGIAQQQGQIHRDMCCDVFDLFTKYATDNAVYFKGYRSNDRHKTQAYKLKMTRFILPRHTTMYSNGLEYESIQLLKDIDKCFAFLDCKAKPDVSLEYVFSAHFDELKRGERVDSSYFQVRWYRTGTIHFFPKDKRLVDMLNRMVGQKRGWLPPEGERVSEDFWLQFDRAEKFDKEVRASIESNRKFRNDWDHPFNRCTSSDDTERERAVAAIDDALSTVLESHGINPDFLIESTPQQVLLELKAA